MGKFKSLSKKSAKKYLLSLSDNEKDSWDIFLHHVITENIDEYSLKNQLVLEEKEYNFVKDDFKSEESFISLTFNYHNLLLIVWYYRSGVCDIVADCYNSKKDDISTFEDEFKGNYTAFEDLMNDVLERVDNNKDLDKSIQTKKSKKIDDDDICSNFKRDGYGITYLVLGVFLVIATVYLTIKEKVLRVSEYLLLGALALVCFAAGIYELVKYNKIKKAMEEEKNKKSLKKSHNKKKK